MSLHLSCTTEEKIRITLNPKIEGEAKQLTANVRVAAVDAGSVQLVDSMNFLLIPPPEPGSMAFILEADLDMGDGDAKFVRDFIFVHVHPPTTTGLGLVGTIERNGEVIPSEIQVGS